MPLNCYVRFVIPAHLSFGGGAFTVPEIRALMLWRLTNSFDLIYCSFKAIFVSLVHDYVSYTSPDYYTRSLLFLILLFLPPIYVLLLPLFCFFILLPCTCDTP